MSILYLVIAIATLLGVGYLIKGTCIDPLIEFNERKQKLIEMLHIYRQFYYNFPADQDWYSEELSDEEKRDVMLQVTNRYMQPEIRVIFDIWSKVEIGALTEYYELLKLEKPTEFNEELVWSSIVGGWKGSDIRVTPTPFSLADLLDR